MVQKQIPQEFAVMIVPANLMQGIANYLKRQPWEEVDEALQKLKTIPVVDSRDLPGKKE